MKPIYMAANGWWSTSKDLMRLNRLYYIEVESPYDPTTQVFSIFMASLGFKQL